jgi:hypothetical protein
MTEMILVPVNEYECSMDAKLTYCEESDAYFFWAGHDCDGHDLYLTVMATENDIANIKFINSDHILVNE